MNAFRYGVATGLAVGAALVAADRGSPVLALIALLVALGLYQLFRRDGP